MSADFALYCILNTVVVVLISPLFVSLVKKVKAWTQGRQGPSVFQTYYTLAKLLKKETIYSPHASWVSRVAPVACMAAILTASLFVPLVYVTEPYGGIGNIILFLYLLVVARFFMALLGLDAGSAFGGMGSSREMSVSAVIEPTTIVVFAALAFVFKSLNIFDMMAAAVSAGTLKTPILILLAISLFIILIVETSRIPVDNPETHLELTMIHEGMILEQSGKEPCTHGTVSSDQTDAPYGAPHQSHRAVGHCNNALRLLPSSRHSSSSLFKAACSPLSSASLSPRWQRCGSSGCRVSS